MASSINFVWKLLQDQKPTCNNINVIGVEIPNVGSNIKTIVSKYI